MIGMREIALTERNFDSEVLQARLPVLVDFYAQWCGPCRMLAPIMAEIAEEYAGKIKVCKVDVDDAPSLVARYRIGGVPAVIAFRNGERVDSSVGYKTKEQILALLR